MLTVNKQCLASSSFNPNSHDRECILFIIPFCWHVIILNFHFWLRGSDNSLWIVFYVKTQQRSDNGLRCKAWNSHLPNCCVSWYTPFCSVMFRSHPWRKAEVRQPELDNRARKTRKLERDRIYEISIKIYLHIYLSTICGIRDLYINSKASKGSVFH